MSSWWSECIFLLETEKITLTVELKEIVGVENANEELECCDHHPHNKLNKLNGGCQSSILLKTKVVVKPI